MKLLITLLIILGTISCRKEHCHKGSDQEKLFSIKDYHWSNVTYGEVGTIIEQDLVITDSVYMYGYQYNSITDFNSQTDIIKRRIRLSFSYNLTKDSLILIGGTWNQPMTLYKYIGNKDSLMLYEANKLSIKFYSKKKILL